LLLKVNQQISECLERAAEADARADVTNDAVGKSEYRRLADGWRTLARSYEFQGSLGRFISFNKNREQAITPAPTIQSSPVALERKGDFLDWVACVSERVRPYSAAAFGIAAASVAIATLLRFVGGWASSDLRFANTCRRYWPRVCLPGCRPLSASPLLQFSLSLGPSCHPILN
jgi:hypothetical protein